MNPREERLLKALMSRGSVTAAMVPTIQAKAGTHESLEDVLVGGGLMEREAYLTAVAQAMGVARASFLPPYAESLKGIVPADMAEELVVFPLEIEHSPRGELLHVALMDPSDVTLLDSLAARTNFKIRPYLATREEILAAIRSFYFAFDLMESEPPVEPMDLLELVEEVPAIPVAPPDAARVPIPAPELTSGEPLDLGGLEVNLDPAATASERSDLFDAELSFGADAGADAASGGDDFSVSLVGGSGMHSEEQPLRPGWGTDREVIADELMRGLSGDSFDPEQLPHPNVLIVGIARALAPGLAMPPEQLIQIVLETLERSNVRER